MTSPPYWALRDYGIKGQVGLEKTFEEHITKMCDVFDEVKRVLRKDGTCWVNYGDTFASSGGVNNPAPDRAGGKAKGTRGTQPSAIAKGGVNRPPVNLPTKSLVMIPFRFAIEMVNRGWILRNVIIWHKPNPMPSSAKDRFTVDFEYLFFFSKSRQYWFEQQFEKYAPASDVRYRQKIREGKQYNSKEPYKKNMPYHTIKRRSNDKDGLVVGGYEKRGRNTRSVWKIPTQPFPEAHFAVYPEKLCRIPIKAGCPEFICKKCGKAREKIMKDMGEKTWKDTREGGSKGTYKTGTTGLTFGRTSQKEMIGWNECKCNAGFRKGIVLDPFMGAGTTAVVARKLGRDYVGIELSKEYIKIAEKRLQQQRLI